MGELLRTGARRVRPAVRPPVFAPLDRLPRDLGRLHARPRNRLLRELAARDVRAARLRRREPDDVAGLRRPTLGAHGIPRSPPRHADARPPDPPVPHLPGPPRPIPPDD